MIEFSTHLGYRPTGRTIPDVAYNAAIIGGVLAAFSVPLGQPAFFRFGGTSAGSPQ
jgi:hypothetical protein